MCKRWRGNAALYKTHAVVGLVSAVLKFPVARDAFDAAVEASLQDQQGKEGPRQHCGVCGASAATSLSPQALHKAAHCGLSKRSVS
jgi:hypothetical protein